MPYYEENKELLQQGVASQYHFESADTDLGQFQITNTSGVESCKVEEK
ncbi:hypothetical protein SANA_20190 [Gottschalkiaceae bacterium SANA]|nr:hypothetical protein SANA_20190 [Gottschalkiaceae bacterium SANA]